MPPPVSRTGTPRGHTLQVLRPLPHTTRTLLPVSPQLPKTPSNLCYSPVFKVPATENTGAARPGATFYCLVMDFEIGC